MRDLSSLPRDKKSYHQQNYILPSIQKSKKDGTKYRYQT